MTKKGSKSKGSVDVKSNSKSAVESGVNSKGKKKTQRQLTKKAYDSKSKKQPQRKNIIKISVQFLKDARTELKKVKWPTKKELLASTTMVIILVLIVAFYLGLVDFGLMNLINRIVG